MSEEGTFDVETALDRELEARKLTLSKETKAVCVAAVNAVLKHFATAETPVMGSPVANHHLIRNAVREPSGTLRDQIDGALGFQHRARDPDVHTMRNAYKAKAEIFDTPIGRVMDHIVVGAVTPVDLPPEVKLTFFPARNGVPRNLPGDPAVEYVIEGSRLTDVQLARIKAVIDATIKNPGHDLIRVESALDGTDMIILQGNKDRVFAHLGRESADLFHLCVEGMGAGAHVDCKKCGGLDSTPLTS